MKAAMTVITHQFFALTQSYGGDLGPGAVKRRS
jgi:hypothetical protein